MSGILRLESLTKGNTLKQGDKTPLKYRLFDADGETLNIAGKSAQVRLVYPDFLTIGYKKDGLTVAQDDTVTFTIDSVIPSRIYHVEIIVDDQFIFPSRADESKFTVDKSSLGTEANVIEVVGVDAVIDKVLGQVQGGIDDVLSDITQSEADRVQAEQQRQLGYEEVKQIIQDGATPADNSVTRSKLADESVTPTKTTFINVSSNLFNENDMLDGQAIERNTGNLYELASYSTTKEYIPLEPNTYYTYYAGESGVGAGRVAYFDIAGNIIKTSDIHDSVGFLTEVSPNNVTKALVHVPKNRKHVAQINVGEEILPYERWYQTLSEKNMPTDVMSTIDMIKSVMTNENEPWEVI